MEGDPQKGHMQAAPLQRGLEKETSLGQNWMAGDERRISDTFWKETVTSTICWKALLSHEDVCREISQTRPRLHIERILWECLCPYSAHHVQALSTVTSDTVHHGLKISQQSEGMRPWHVADEGVRCGWPTAMRWVPTDYFQEKLQGNQAVVRVP